MLYIMKYSLAITCLLLVQSIIAQPSTEIYLFDLDNDGRLSRPLNVSDNPGYDNQPSFTRGGGHLLYASTRGGQTDILKYEIETGEKSWMTATEAGEYSPTHIPGSYEFSTISLEPDGRQLLWKYSLNGGNGEILIPYLKIGYHAWVHDQLLYAFVLGPHSTLQRINLSAKRAEIVREDIGRSLIYIAEKESLAFIDKASEPWMVSLLQLRDHSESFLSASLPESEDMTYHNGFLWMGQGTKLFRMKIEPDSKWMETFDIATFGLGEITRLTIHPDGNKIAIVVTE